jgi:chemotaxis signal transduction protein
MYNVDATQIDNYLPYMRDVIRCEQSLHELNLMWRMIESSAKMNCPVEAKSILPTMAETRAGFNLLEKELVLSLVNEKVATVLNEIGTKAQYLIDILVRNLYERTADVGFLATDKELCNFVASPSVDNEGKIQARLLAYRNKYTVYDEILLLDIHGNILVHIDKESPVEGSLDPLIKKTLTSDDYVETYRATDLRPHKNKSLIYSKRMLHPETGKVIGVLCLCFNLEQEMSGVFKSHGDPSNRSVMLLLDGENTVIESSDTRWIPVGVTVPVNKNIQSSLIVYGGREYLIRSLSSEGYQGYMGPIGWQGQVMIPVEIAFTGKQTSALKALDSDVERGLLTHAQSFCPPLYKVMNAASTIRRVVWNGQVMTAGQGGELLKLKTILDQISETGARSNELFTNSINDLYETVLASRMQNSEFVSNLLMDLLDRNLYERSDDCRWWALTPDIRLALESETVSAQTASKLTEILTYINELYTVYTRIFVYDRNGTIVASTNALSGEESVIGKQIDDITLTNVMGLRTDQEYHVSQFSASELYEHAQTYIYHAAIKSSNSNANIGGIGLVFDSTPEFLAMLQGGITNKDSYKAFYIDRQGRIISSTDPSRPVGSILQIDQDLLNLKNGQATSRIVIHDDHYAILGCSVSNGYREFKVSDGYKEDVIAVVYDIFGEVRERFSSGEHTSSIINTELVTAEDPEFATFFIDEGLFAIPAEYVMEALPASEITAVSIGARSERVGMIEMRNGNKGRAAHAWVFDLGYLLSGISVIADSNNQVIVVECENHKIGLLVGALHSVTQFSENQITSTPMAMSKNGSLINNVIKANNGELLIQSIDINYLLRMLSNPFAPVEPVQSAE